MSDLIKTSNEKNAGPDVDKHKDEYGLETPSLQIQGLGCGCEGSMVER
jgi:hypothetical protein